MAVNAWGSREQKATDEVFFSNDAVSLCLLVGRRTKTMRVIDFRAGPSNRKRQFVLKLAQREGVDKIYTLVERDEVGTWTKLGFTKEGNIPGFYKRSDAFLLGCPADAPITSETRLSIGSPLIAPPPEDDEDDEITPDAPSAGHDRAEKTVAQSKKLAKELADRPLPIARVATVKEADVRKAADKAQRAGRALTAFEPFGRDVVRHWYHVTARGAFELYASVESQACFGNAFLELLTAPRNEAERMATVSAVRALCDELTKAGVVSCFALAPSDDPGLGAAFAFNGFRRTGLLSSHLLIAGERKDAILWSRKLANPATD